MITFATKNNDYLCHQKTDYLCHQKWLPLPPKIIMSFATKKRITFVTKKKNDYLYEIILHLNNRKWLAFVISIEPDQPAPGFILLADQLQILILISLKMKMDSSIKRKVGYSIKKFSRLRVMFYFSCRRLTSHVYRQHSSTDKQ